jgi:hypothetical protein
MAILSTLSSLLSAAKKASHLPRQSTLVAIKPEP